MVPIATLRCRTNLVALGAVASVASRHRIYVYTALVSVVVACIEISIDLAVVSQPSQGMSKAGSMLLFKDIAVFHNTPHHKGLPFAPLYGFDVGVLDIVRDDRTHDKGLVWIERCASALDGWFIRKIF